MVFVKDFSSCLVASSVTIKEALKAMDIDGHQILMVVDDEGHLLGIVTDGDMRRAMIRSVSLDQNIETVINRNYKYIHAGADQAIIRETFCNNRFNHLVLLDDERKVTGLVLRGDILCKEETHVSLLDNPVIIMAGGRGSRLDPFTKILPKPMIPLGDKPIIEHIMDRFCRCGFSNFFISVNYKKEIIKLYFNEQDSYRVSFLEEEQPLGTAGSLSLVANKFTETIVVTNCDVIIETNYREIYNFHHKNGNSITIVGSMRHIKVPYGVINLQESNFTGIVEKPEYDVLINSGLYFLEPQVLEMIPHYTVFDMPDLIDLAKERGMKIGVYPVYNSWYDVGQWDEYHKTLKEFT